MFFVRLRQQAKWFFVLLALMFAASTVLFGVGTGFGGLQDILLQDRAIFEGPSEGEARERISENPNDAQGYRDLSTALQNKGEVEASITPLSRYVQLRPQDLDAKRELAGLYLRKGQRHRSEAIAAQAALQREVPGQTFQPPPGSTIGQALGNDPLNAALAARHQGRLNAALTTMQTAYANAVRVYREIAEAEPNDPAVQFELAQTAESANDVETAIAAYKRFLELAPEDPSAEAVQSRVEQLEAQLPGIGDG